MASTVAVEAFISAAILLKKRPMYMAKEAYVYGKRGLLFPPPPPPSAVALGVLLVHCVSFE